MKISQIICEMNINDAIGFFKQMGYDTATMSPEEIKTAYRSLMRKHHPDYGGNNTIATNINIAYNLLKNYKKEPEPEKQQYYKPPPRKPPENEPERPRNDFRQSWTSRVRDKYGY
jgi:curved DNA-binding protein CbpA